MNKEYNIYRIKILVELLCEYNKVDILEKFSNQELSLILSNVNELKTFYDEAVLNSYDN